MRLLLTRVVGRAIGEPSPELVEEIRGILKRAPGEDYRWPGNVRELEQAVRRILITGRYNGENKRIAAGAADARTALLSGIEQGGLNAQEVLAGYCSILYEQHGTYEEVARITGLDRRTVKKHIQSA